MGEVQLGYLALSLCVVAATSLAVALALKIMKKSKLVLITAWIALLSTATSLVIYCYLRFALSGGTLQDGRVVFVLFVYGAAGILSVLTIIDAAKKLVQSRMV